MKRAVRNLAVGVAMAGSLTACGEDTPTNFIDVTDRIMVTDTVKKTGAFWGENGYGLGANLNAAILVGPDSYTCGDAPTIRSNSLNITYCHSDNTLVVPVAAVNRIRTDSPARPKTAVKLWLRTAIGGMIQAIDPSLLKNAPPEHAGEYAEFQRACLGGVATRHLAPEETADAFRILLHSSSEIQKRGHWLARGYQHGYQHRHEAEVERPGTAEGLACTDIPLPPAWLQE